MPDFDGSPIAVTTDADIVAARQSGRALAAELGFTGSDLTVIATAISEVARNIINYGVKGEIVLRSVNRGDRSGIEIVATDWGPGIPDIGLAMQDGYSTSRSLGIGLPGVRRLMDEVDVSSKVGQGTTVVMKKWRD
jgi:serine/threonine-protein kinase RsbT